MATLGSVEVERWNSDALRHPIAALSEEVEQYFETPNQALMSRPWTSSKKSSVSFVCIELSPHVAEGRTTARNKRASIAGDIFDSGMRAATLAQAAMPLFLRWSKWPVSVPLVWKTTPRYVNLETNSIGLLLHVITSDLAKCPPLLNFIILVLPRLMPR